MNKLLDTFHLIISIQSLNWITGTLKKIKYGSKFTLTLTFRIHCEILFFYVLFSPTQFFLNCDFFHISSFSEPLLDENIHYSKWNLDLFCMSFSVISRTVEKFCRCLMICSGSMGNLQSFSVLTAFQATILCSGISKPVKQSSSSWSILLDHNPDGAWIQIYIFTLTGNAYSNGTLTIKSLRVKHFCTAFVHCYVASHSLTKTTLV